MANTQTKNREQIMRLAQISMIVAIMLVLQLTGLGFIKIPIASFTTMHIPVIVGAIVLGPFYGGVLGGAFGIMSMLEATFKATAPADLAFSPFYSGNPVSSIIMSIGVRILLGIVTGLVFRALMKRNFNSYVTPVIAAFLGTLTNTVGVLLCLWFLFPDLEVNFKIFLKAIVTMNFVFEATLAIVFALAFAKALPALNKYIKK